MKPMRHIGSWVFYCESRNRKLAVYISRVLTDDLAQERSLGEIPPPPLQTTPSRCRLVRSPKRSSPPE
ncbi:hypothetical protein F2P81_015031 [Scophthalmus maximus]|uniref:Uncharacterized protein n=1 Tax=Scophthalmus maximus TaxID=52904 RepID=A0A6A4SNT4_SCOMX|nr:hypothetical protein F2P81_015031 [Scophthalmus maximus]